MIFTILLGCVFWGEHVHVLVKAFTLCFRGMTIVVTVVMLKSPSGRGFNQLSGIRMSTLCVMLTIWVPREKGFNLTWLHGLCFVGNSHPLESACVVGKIWMSYGWSPMVGNIWISCGWSTMFWWFFV